MSTPRGVAWSSTSTASRSSDKVRGTIRSATSTDAMVSIGVHPVARITIPATSTATEPNRSPMTSRYAPRRFRLRCAPAWSSRMATTLTARPIAAIASIGAARTSGGDPMRPSASTRITAATTKRMTALATAARISTRA